MPFAWFHVDRAEDRHGQTNAEVHGEQIAARGDLRGPRYTLRYCIQHGLQFCPRARVIRFGPCHLWSLPRLRPPLMEALRKKRVPRG